MNEVVNVLNYLFSATTCNHLQCFDAAIYIGFNEKKQTFICPVCNQHASYKNLVIDEYFQEVLSSSTLSADDSEIELKSDGTWNKICNKDVFFNLDATPEVKPRSQIQSTNNQCQKVAMQTIDLTETPVKPTLLKRRISMPTKINATVDLTSSDSDDDTIECYPMN